MCSLLVKYITVYQVKWIIVYTEFNNAFFKHLHSTHIGVLQVKNSLVVVIMI